MGRRIATIALAEWGCDQSLRRRPCQAYLSAPKRRPLSKLILPPVLSLWNPSQLSDLADHIRCRRPPARKCRSIPCEPGTSRRCWRAFRSSSGRRRSGPENPFRSSSFRKRVSTASGFIGCCKAKASKAMSSILAADRDARADGGAPMANGDRRRGPRFARCWRGDSAANLGCARW